MNTDSELTIRRAQTIAPFGVGAIYDISGQSFVAKDISKWFKNGQAIGDPIELSRLSNILNVSGFRSAPAISSDNESKYSPGAPYMRFPRWLFCSDCRKMVHLGDRNDLSVPTCESCESKNDYLPLVPMRFVGICDAGHLDDVPWRGWAHSGTDLTLDQKNCGNRFLKFLASSSEGGRLQSLSVECSTCSATKSLKDINHKGAMIRIGFKCPGIQPWDRNNTIPCNSDFRIQQRGASNVHFAVIKTALDIPPNSDHSDDRLIREKVIGHDYIENLRTGFPFPEKWPGIAKSIGDDIGTDADAVLKIANEHFEQVPSTKMSEVNDEILEVGEWAALNSDRSNYDNRDNFVAERVSLEHDVDSNQNLFGPSGAIDRLVVIKKLREVRAFQGFNRLEHDPSEDGFQPADLGHEIDWLPAIESYGEGFFLRLNEEYVHAWESSSFIEDIERKTRDRVKKLDLKWLPEVSSRLVMVHTLSHMVIRRAAFVAGYSLSSIRERLYVSNLESKTPMAGILIYTASGDSEGSLGGLVRSGETKHLSNVINSALVDALWCSQDPVCRESFSGPGAINAAACHACCLLPETSCQFGNRLLDRRTVVGDGKSLPGYMDSIIGNTAQE